MSESDEPCVRCGTPALGPRITGYSYGSDVGHFGLPHLPCSAYITADELREKVAREILSSMPESFVRSYFAGSQGTFDSIFVPAADAAIRCMRGEAE